jgi:hypothetical protein
LQVVPIELAFSHFGLSGYLQTSFSSPFQWTSNYLASLVFRSWKSVLNLNGPIFRSCDCLKDILKINNNIVYTISCLCVHLITTIENNYSVVYFMYF